MGASGPSTHTQMRLKPDFSPSLPAPRVAAAQECLLLTGEPWEGVSWGVQLTLLWGPGPLPAFLSCSSPASCRVTAELPCQPFGVPCIMFLISRCLLQYFPGKKTPNPKPVSTPALSSQQQRRSSRQPRARVCAIATNIIATCWDYILSPLHSR